MTHICVSKLTIIASDNGLSPGRRQAIIWNNDGILLIWPLGTRFSEILIEIHSFSFKKMHLKMSSGKWWPFCLGLNVLNRLCPRTTIFIQQILSYRGRLTKLALQLAFAYHKKLSNLKPAFNLKLWIDFWWRFIIIKNTDSSHGAFWLKWYTCSLWW